MVAFADYFGVAVCWDFGRNWRKFCCSSICLYDVLSYEKTLARKTIRNITDNLFGVDGSFFREQK